MPLTFPAHQGLIGAVKLRWPNHIDGTALCIGAASPDLAYAMGDWLNRQSHTAIGVVVWAVPITIVATLITRWRSAAGVFAHLPDVGPLRVRSYRVLGLRRPAPATTLLAATIGAGSHVLIDSFSHRRRWGANVLGLNRVLFEVPIGGEVTPAKLIQYFGHGFGSLAFVWLLWLVARRGLLESWYGKEAVAAARSHRPPRRERVLFWAVVSIPVLMTIVIAVATDRSPIFAAIAVLLATVLAAGAVVPSGRSGF